MFKELGFMTDNLNSRGVNEGDYFFYKRFSGVRKKVFMHRTHYIFSTDQSDQGHRFQRLDSVQGEKLKFEIILVDSISRNGQELKRYFMRSLCRTPFLLNGNYVFEAFIENLDEVEFGYNKLHFHKTVQPRPSESFNNKYLTENKKIIESKVNLLLIGETGVGKTSLARKIHEFSTRRGEFIHLNLSSFSENLLESELFGHVKGSFTGALNDKIGAIRRADKGTLFLDEVDSVSKKIQTKLLLFFDDFLVKPVGSDVSRKVDVRIICSSGRKIELLNNEKNMRKDFFFRIASGDIINMPPLRECPLLIKNLCLQFSKDKNLYIDEKLIEFYQTLPWHGNIRQLLGHLDKKKALTSCNKLAFDDVDNKLITQSAQLDNLDDLSIVTMADVKKQHALKTYYQFQKNYTLAAQSLNISARTLKKMIGDLSA